MNHITQIIVAIFASTGFWSVINLLISNYQRKKDATSEKQDAQSAMLLGLGHDRIVYLGSEYIKRGSITNDEYENLHDYLYLPYEKLGGNGTASKVMKEVEKLKLKN